MKTTITREDGGPVTDVDEVGHALHAFNVAYTGEHTHQPVRFFVRDDAGAVAGGLIADVYLDWMFVQMLWLDEKLRGGGTGAELMGRAEEAARELGCSGIWLDTFSFQAPGFYRKLGFEEFGRLDEYPRGFSRHFFRKMLR